jgi:glycosyltransferase involved in cell wall biosynthesis
VGAEHLHAHFGTNSAGVAALCRALGGPSFSFTVHGPEEFDKPEALSLTDKISAASLVVGVSEFGRSQLYRWTPLDQWPKVRVARCGVDEQFLDPRTEPSPVPRAPALVCVGRLCEQKGQALLVEAAARLAREGREFTLTLCGDGPMRGPLEAAVRAGGLEKHVLFTGSISGAEVRRRIEASRALVLPSFAEGLPVVIMEALALGRPVVSTYVAGIPELVEPGVSGWLAPAGSLDALVDAIRAVLDADPRHLSARGRAGRARVAERHDALREAARLVKLFRAAATGEPLDDPRDPTGSAHAPTPPELEAARA